MDLKTGARKSTQKRGAQKREGKQSAFEYERTVVRNLALKQSCKTGNGSNAASEGSSGVIRTNWVVVALNCLSATTPRS